MTATTTAAPAPDTTPAAPTPAAAPAGEEAELLALHASDPQVFEHSPTWRDSGKTAAARLYELRQARAGDDKTEVARQTEPSSVGDINADDVDLDAAEGEPGEHAEAAEPEAPELDFQYDRADFSWTPPDGAQVTEAGQQRIDAFAEFAHKANMVPEVFESAVGWYNDLVAKEQAKLVEADKAAMKSAVEALGGRETYAPLVDTAKSVLKTWPKDLRDAVRDARTSDGRRLALMPQFVELLASMGQRQATPQPQDRRTAMQAEIQALDQMMLTDISAYNRRGYRGRDISASDRKLEILRELDKPTPKPTAAEVRGEEAELLALHQSDPSVFEYSGWKNTGMSGAQRLYQIRSGRG